MKEETESELADKDLLSVIEINKQCNDCGKKDPRWCSINNAVLLCSTCARTHKKFNINISNIKSLEVDPWTKQEINFVKLGGNERFTNLIKSYNIPLKKENQEYKYYTRAAQYYRNILVEESKNSKNNIIKPSLREGIEILYKDEYSNLFNKYSNNNQQNNDNNENVKNENNTNNNLMNNNNSILENNNNNYNQLRNNNASWVDKIIEKIAPDVDIPPNYPNKNNNNESNTNDNKMGNIFDNFTNNMFYAINDVKEKAKDIDFKEKIKMAREYVQNKTEKIQNSDTFKGIVNTVSNGIDTLIQKTDQFFRPEQNKVYINNTNNNQNILSNNNIESNSPFIKNNNQNLNLNTMGNVNNDFNTKNMPTFKSNYSSIDNNKNESYNNYINELSGQIINNNINNNNVNNVNNLNIEMKDNKDTSNNKEKLDNIEKNNEDNIESLDNLENDNNPNILIMSNTPKNN